jgi:antibiotic biosynthesis monooxygenase (ABM) superfamily enzyme
MKPRQKEGIVTWVGVNVTAFALTLTPTPVISGWPWFAGFLAFNTVAVIGLTWLVMPASTRIEHLIRKPRHAHETGRQDCTDHGR